MRQRMRCGGSTGNLVGVHRLRLRWAVRLEKQISHPKRMRCFSSTRYVAVLPPGHVFPMSKFAESARMIGEHSIATVIDPGAVSITDLLRVHEQDYVESIRTGNYNQLTRLKLGLPWHPTIFTRSCHATQGTLLAARAAMEDGIAANLAGGTHHAFPDRGEGFCVFNDVAVAVRHLQRDEPMLQVFVVDLDAHQGNGVNFIFQNDANVFTYSMHVGRNYPSQKQPGSLDVELPRWVTPQVYFEQLHATLPIALERFEPDLVFYNAGVDVHEHDRFGQMKLATSDMHQRDRFVVDLCRNWRIPTTVVYGGGYNPGPEMTAKLHVQTVCIAAKRYCSERGLDGPTWTIGGYEPDQ